MLSFGVNIKQKEGLFLHMAKARGFSVIDYFPKKNVIFSLNCLPNCSSVSPENAD